MSDEVLSNLEKFHLENKTVLLVWRLGTNTEDLQKLVEELKRKTKDVFLENNERVALANFPNSSFDIILLNALPPFEDDHSDAFLENLLKLLKPQAQLIYLNASPDNLRVRLLLLGYVNVAFTTEGKSTLLVASKPNFEVGAASKLSFIQPVQPVENVWSLTDNLVDDEIELVDEETLLEETDLIKPDAASLKVCGTTGKRKACKDCSCGLAEELEVETGKKVVQTKSATSACGSCYLGDAFRCASCPYLGMPAFKPGEKIQLSTRQLNPDL
uniref:Anamorsin homolog n=1 Tax=Lynceus sp. MCZ IZ 141354 TaxID=1930659 RepID=A0A9N6WUZ1_9CRUS|nr:EOG090X0FGQ [Lynceus sp. MCZ IZ 141354]